MALGGAEQVRDDADARAPKRVSAEELSVAGRDVALAEGSDGIGRVVAGHHIEQQRRVSHRARDRADLVLGQAVGNDAGPAHKATGRADANEVVGGGRRAHRRGVI